MDYIDVMEEGENIGESDDDSISEDAPFALKRKTRCTNIHKLLKDDLIGGIGNKQCYFSFSDLLIIFVLRNRIL